jgi:DNA-binding CsgD family transcriptional regulator
MDKCKINIAVIEPSDILYEGLSNLLLKSKQHFYIFRLNELDDINKAYGDISYHIAIINPIVLQNKTSEFQKLKRNRPNLFWIGLVYSFFDARILHIFDDTFSITDPIEALIRKLNLLFDKGNCTESLQEQLSERETEILIQLVKGFSHKEIADLLNISIHTVTSHRKNIIEKTGIKSLSGLTIYAITKKIIPLDSISPFIEH